MATLLRVPEVAAGATEVVLAEWLVAEGGAVEKGEPVVVVETEKAVVEVEAEAGGTLLRRLVEGGATVEVGAPLALVGSEAERDDDIDELLAGLGVDSVPSAPVGTEPEPAPVPAAAEEPLAAPARERIFATPVARRVLAEGGVELSAVTGTGPNGRILKKDAEEAVRAAAGGRHGSPAAAVPSGERRAGSGFHDEPHSRLRRAVANRLTQSKQTVPHFYVRRTVRVDALLELRRQLNEVSEQRVSVNDLVVRAAAVAHRAVPEANVIWTDEAMRHFDTVDIGVAISSERGLVTPVLRGVESSTPATIARNVRAFVDQANTGKLQQKDLEGGSISVTNLGMYGVDEFAAIINPPQSAILAVGAAVPTPWVVEGVVEVATVMTLVLSVDHRAIDGALAAHWMAGLVIALEQPIRLLA